LIAAGGAAVAGACAFLGAGGAMVAGTVGGAGGGEATALSFKTTRVACPGRTSATCVAGRRPGSAAETL
jgi:hypothetical protein